MSFITREDGEHFVIPSYRDVLTVKQASQLKKEILLLSKSYGEYITLHKKSATQYEVAFSSDTGYLLGESVWQNFKRPLDLIYCEAIPNTNDAILVIVKSGSVYLDGAFSLDSIPEELIIFLTQQNNFEIYTYGNVPISQEPEAGKFSFEASSVKSFQVLDTPAFPALSLYKMYQLQLVDTVLKSQGIGVFPLRPVLIVFALIAIGWLGWSYLSTEKVVVVETKQEVNPYLPYFQALKSSAPDQEVQAFTKQLARFYQMPGWGIKDIKYIHGSLNVTVLSNGGKVAGLYEWAKRNKANVMIKNSGVTITKSVSLPDRRMTTTITPISKIIAALVDRISNVYPGNNLDLGDTVNKNVFGVVSIKIKFTNVSPVVINLIGEQFAGLPLTLHDITIKVDDSNDLSGSITVEALGN